MEKHQALLAGLLGERYYLTGLLTFLKYATIKKIIGYFAYYLAAITCI